MGSDRSLRPDRLGLRIATLLAAALALAGSPPAAALQPERSARAVAIVDGDTLVLEDGLEVRLVGIQAPKLPLGRPGFEAWPLAEEAKAALGRLALNRRVALAYGGRRVDRHGRALAHLTLEDGTWVQGRLLALGMARVYSFADNRALVAEMLALERDARAAGLGIWAEPFYALRRAEALSAGAREDIGTFQLVEGRVRAAAEVRGRVYLNFAEDWRSDFTVSLAPAVRRLFEREGLDPLAYEGRRLRVRGWLHLRNGPMIEATHPEQIELLED